MKQLLLILFVLIGNVAFTQKANVAIIVDEHSSNFDVVFFSKLILLFVIAVIALVSYFNYKKEEN